VSRHDGDRAAVALGYQRARAGHGDELADANRALRSTLRSTLRAGGLLDYAVMRSELVPDEFCAYWLWRSWADREALWHDPPPELAAFVAAARPLWAGEPRIVRYSWAGAAAPSWRPGDRVRTVSGPVAGSGDLQGAAVLAPHEAADPPLACAAVAPGDPADDTTWLVL
jgi:quinol monooxygenase YgiN